MDSLNKLQQFRQNLPAIPDFLTTLNDTVNSGVDTRQSFVTYRNDYYYYRNLAYLYANEYDGQRVLFINVLFFMPMFLALLGVLGCVLQKPCPLMWMALSSIPMMAVLFVFCAVIMIPSVIVDDFCVARDTIVTTNAQHIELPTDALEFKLESTNAGAFNTSASQNLTASDLYQYLTTCNAPRVQNLVDQMLDPTTVLRRAGLNFTAQVSGVRDSAQSQGYQLRAGISAQLDGFNVPFDAAQQVLVHFATALQCSDNNALHLSLQAFYAGMCDRLMTSLCMCTALLFVAAACSFPGICIGIRAYKRLDPANFTDRVKKDDDDADPGTSLPLCLRLCLCLPPALMLCWCCALCPDQTVRISWTTVMRRRRTATRRKWRK